MKTKVILIVLLAAISITSCSTYYTNGVYSRPYCARPNYKSTHYHVYTPATRYYYGGYNGWRHNHHGNGHGRR